MVEDRVGMVKAVQAEAVEMMAGIVMVGMEVQELILAVPAGLLVQESA